MIISHYDDNANIFHVLLKEFPVLMQYMKDYKRRDLVLKHTKSNAGVMDYRKMIYTPFFNVVTYNVNAEEAINLQKFPYTIFNPFKYQPLKKHIEFCNALSVLKEYYYTENPKAPNIVFSLRKQNRILIDTHTNSPIEDLIVEKYGQQSIVYFESMDAVEQLRILQNCKIFCGVHGANLVNLVFTRTNAHVIEIDFKKHWNCDPICNEHFNGTLQPHEKCKGKLTRGCYHKADYHNLSLLCGKKYTSISAENIEKYNDRNPINVQKVYIDFQKLVMYIDTSLKTLQ